jgi:UDP-glucose 4-epimerase
MTTATGEWILVTGGAGYIGTHTLVELLAAGYEAVCFDNFSNSEPEALRRVNRIAGRPTQLVHGDIRDEEALARAFASAPVSAVIHFAALKSVADSMADPLRYYHNNVSATATLLRACQRAGVKRFVFSSSATVYGAPDKLPFTEDMALSPVNTYGKTKAIVEQMLRDKCRCDPQMAVVSLRYFNPIGAHASGLIGEDGRDAPANVFPAMLQVAIGKRERLLIFGGDWPTRDGTGVRDYVHVVDLAVGHISALHYSRVHVGFTPINLGTGRGTSVLDLVRVFEQATGRTVPYSVVERRTGDVAQYWAGAELAARLLNWRAVRSLREMCADGWRWLQANPGGYCGTFVSKEEGFHTRKPSDIAPQPDRV